MNTLQDRTKRPDRLKKRSDFLYVQKAGCKWVAKGLVLQVAKNEYGTIRFGLTVSKKVSKSAVVRNRIRRRLKAASYDILSGKAKAGFDYVLIGRVASFDRPFSSLCRDLEWCLSKLDLLAESNPVREEK